MFLKRKRLNEDPEEADHDHEDESNDDGGAVIVPRNAESRTIGLFGEVEEDKVSMIIGLLLDLSDNPESEVIDGKEVLSDEIMPIEFLISTPGGSADDMFALYDIMRSVREKCDIITFGLGKVMSAGVLLLAAGTKGQRKIGKNCRVMLHSVIGGTSGSFHNIENEMIEMRYTQNAYLKAISDESGLSVKQLKKLINRKVNVYLSAEEAVKYGIADIII